MREAPVGHQCPQCVKDGNKTVRQARTVFGGRVSTTPLVTYTLIAINVVAYLAELASPGLIDRFSGLGEGLARGGKLYVVNGQSYPGFHAVGIAHGEWYRLITSAFLHLLPTMGFLGITHIVFNMWWLWALGRVVEEVMGRLRFLALYLLSALGSSVMAYLIAPQVGGVGASGAIFGLAAAYFIICRRLRRDVAYATRLIGIYLIWLVISASFTSWEAHLGGLLAGGAVALGYAYAPAKRRTIIHAGTTAGILVLAIALVVLKTAQLTGTM
jgi:membrane associated rhomboid family serine protease